MPEKLRIDKYLWAIRVFKTRTQATDACSAGKVKYAGQSVKPSKVVAIGDEYEIKTEARKWFITVSGLLATRAAYEVAQNFYTDQTPEEDKVISKQVAPSFYTGKRLSKQGRPTKKQRRGLEDFMDGTEPKD
jgi:ribosome-associated heat shock protein Hsp15